MSSLCLDTADQARALYVMVPNVLTAIKTDVDTSNVCVPHIDIHPLVVIIIFHWKPIQPRT